MGVSNKNKGEQKTLGKAPFNKLFTRNVPHILEKIFFSLDYASFKECMEVHRAWHELLTSKSFKQFGKLTFQREIETALWHATRSGNAKEARAVLSTGMVNIECIDKDVTPLFTAVEKGHKDLVQLLLEAGANPNSPSTDFEFDWTPLYWAALRGDHDVAKLLIEAGGNVNMEARDGKIPLHLAKGRKVVKLLLDEGSHLHKECASRNTPLHYASMGGRIDVVKFLLERGADPNRPGIRGKTPFHSIFTFNPVLISNSKLIAKLLIDNGANVNMVDNNGHTPLWFALRKGHTEAANLIREHGGV